MILHDGKRDTKNAGQWELRTGRYVPEGGGSRSRLSYDSNGIPRYHGFVGIDEALAESIGTMSALYARLGGGLPSYPEGSYMAMLIEQSKKWIKSGGGEEGA